VSPIARRADSDARASQTAFIVRIRGTSILSRTLPSTWTISVTVSSAARDGSYVGHDDTWTDDPFPTLSRHNSSAANGANGASIGGQDGRGSQRSDPASSAVRISFVSTCGRRSPC
jgi:hypothetical protein